MNEQVIGVLLVVLVILVLAALVLLLGVAITLLGVVIDRVCRLGNWIKERIKYGR